MQGSPEQTAEQHNKQQIYMDALQLDQPPFANDTRPDHAFINDQWQQNLDQLTHLVQSSNLLLAVSAEDGLGKSTLSRLFIQQAGNHLRCCFIEVNEQLDAQQLLIQLAQCLDIPTADDAQVLLQLLLEQGKDLQRNDTRPVVILDNAQLLSDSTLDQLLQLHKLSNNQGGSFRILLFTTPQLTTRLIQMQSHLHVIQLTPLDEQGTADYLQHKLIHAGLKQGQIFSDKEIRFIQLHTLGNMHQINLIAHQVLAHKYTRNETIMNNKKSQEKTRFIHKPGVWISLTVAVILSIVLFFQGQINQLVEPTPENESTLALPTFKIAEPKEYLLKKIPDPEPETVTTTETEAPPTPSEPAATPLIASEAQEQPEATGPVEIISEPAPEPVSEPADQTASTVKQQTPAAINTPSMADALAGRLEKYQIKDKDWIMQQPPGSVTAQMSASSKPDALIRQARNPALQGQAAIYQVLRKDSDWYVMVFGSYPDKTHMRQAINKLPDALKKGKPWIRPMSTVQAEIQSGRK